MQMTESLSLVGDGGFTGDSTLFAKITSYINIAYNEVVDAILDVDTNWKFDDANRTDYPEATITMVASQRDYTLPVAFVGADSSTLLKINRVWVLDKNGNRQQLSLMNPNDDFDYSTTGLPSQYRLNGKSIFLDVRPSSTATTLTNGLIIQFERIQDYFTTEDATQEPGFIATYHDLLPLKASSLYLLPINTDLAERYEARFQARLQKLKSAYSYMNDDATNRMQPLTQDNR